MPEAPLVILNPTAGAGRAGRLAGWLRERLGPRPEAHLVVTTRRGEAMRLASESAGHFDRVVAVGGDGTVQEVINGLLDGGAGVASLGIVPVGSGNDLARSLRLPSDAAQAWTVAIGRGTGPLDVLRAQGADGSGRWFASAGGIGFDAQVANAMASRRGWQRGRAGYLLTALAELRRFDNHRVRIGIDGEAPIERTILLVAISNGEYYGGGMRISPGADVEDGCLDLCIVGDISRLGALGQIPNLYRGTHVNHPAVEVRQARSVEIEGDAGALAHLDGEPFGTLPLRVRMHPGLLTVAIPLR